MYPYRPLYLTMPELPEVETVRRGLEKLIVGKQVADVAISYSRMVVTGSDHLLSVLPGQPLLSMGRRGKYLLFHFEDWVLVSHLRMEGKYLFYEGEPVLTKHSHAYFTFTDGTSLVYQDVRKFGTMELMREADLPAYFASKKMGPEPEEGSFLLEPFALALSKSKKPIKPHLLDQTLVVGLGNIYVDEVLWRAGIHPLRISSSLSSGEIAELRRQIIAVLQLGIEKRGSTIRTYKNTLGEIGTMQHFLKVYGQTGQPCEQCRHEIEKIKVGGRGSHFCPSCQELK